MKRVLLVLFTVVFVVVYSFGQAEYTIQGTITDQNGENLIGANVIVPELTKGAVSDFEGNYSLKLPEGNYTLKVQFLGYVDQEERIRLHSDKMLNFRLEEASELIESVEVLAEAPNRNVTKVEMSANKLEMREIQKLPVVFGEGDVIKTLQLLPGVISSGEASGGFHVRGGNVDQNLILVDKAQVYNASHFIGFFSVFNSNVIDDVKLYKGGISSEYGGRLSSVLDVNTIDADIKEYHAEASAGIISSKLMVQGPVLKDKVSFFVAGRRTYADLFLPFSKDSLAKESDIYFYDLNAKVKAVLGDNDRIYLSAYKGKDAFSMGTMMHMKYGNGAYSLHWNHFFNNRLFFNLYGTITTYDYDVKMTFPDFWYRMQTNIFDYTGKAVFNLKLNSVNEFKFGAESIWHNLNPGTVTGFDAKQDIHYDIPNIYSREVGIFFQNQHTLTPRLTVVYGLRYSLFYNIGRGISYTYDKSNPEDYIPVDTAVYDKREVFNFLPNGFEPRLSLRYMIDEKSSVKASYNRMCQYIQLASNSTSSLPLDFWFSSSPNIKPQIADQLAIGYFRNFADNFFEVSVEGFYKDIQNSIDFKDHASLILNDQFEGQLRIGDSWAYGGEFLVRKQKGDFTGWISYTYSRVLKKIPEINGGETYPAAHDKPHDFAIVLSYDVNKRLNLSGTWVYTSAPPRTMPKQRFEYGGMIAPYYGNRNSVRVFSYHRLDLAATYRLNKVKRWYEHSINFSVYNAYAKHNYIMLSFRQDPDDKYVTKAYGTYLYSLVPSLCYTFKF